MGSGPQEHGDVPRRVRPPLVDVLLSRRASLKAAVLVAGAAATTGAVPLGSVPRTLFVLGDSWAAGLYADPQHALGQVAAEALGWGVLVDAVSGSGYLNPASQDASYVTRASRTPTSAIDLVVVQGGSNDGSHDLDDLAPAVLATIETIRGRVGAAPILLLGPGPDPEPVTARQRAVDDIIAAAALQSAVPYVSMLREDWLPADRADAMLDPDDHHPTASAQRYLGERLADAVRTRFPALVTPGR